MVEERLSLDCPIRSCNRTFSSIKRPKANGNGYIKAKASDPASRANNGENSKTASRPLQLSPQDDAQIRQALESRPSMVRAMDRHRAPDDRVGARDEEDAWLADLGYHDNLGYVSTEVETGLYR